MKRTTRTAVVISILCTITIGAIITDAFAIGGGSGGGSSPRKSQPEVSQPSTADDCDEDVYFCTDWSACSSDGTQTRDCILSDDCATVDDPLPNEAQACDAVADEESTETGEQDQETNEASTEDLANDESVDEAEVAEGAVEEAAADTVIETTGTVPVHSNPNCIEDEWSCDSWEECDIYGNQIRACSMTAHCPNADTESPEEDQRCDHLQCGNKENLRERIRCRLNLAPAGISRELEIQYLPEECRVLSNQDEKKECSSLYLSYRPCWSKRIGEERFSCARNVLNLGSSLQSEIDSCNREQSTQRESCISILRQKTYSMIKFRMYDLEERVEEMAEAGLVDLETTADFVALIVEKKLEFNSATTTDERKKAILDVRAAWHEIISQVKAQRQ